MRLPDRSIYGLCFSGDLNGTNSRFYGEDVYNYLVLTIKAKRQVKSRVYFFRIVMYMNNDTIMSATNVHIALWNLQWSLPGQVEQKGRTHITWFGHRLLSKVTGNVHSADYNCTADNVHCSCIYHVNSTHRCMYSVIDKHLSVNFIKF